jgi:hypothetical protein
MENSTKKNDNHEEIESIEKPSYTYWKRETDKPFSTEFTPQRSNSNIQQENCQSSVGSAWNRAGTW